MAKSEERAEHKYVARHPIGTDKKGNTQYRYFYDTMEYKAFLASNGKSQGVINIRTHGLDNNTSKNGSWNKTLPTKQSEVKTEHNLNKKITTVPKKSFFQTIKDTVKNIVKTVASGNIDKAIDAGKNFLTKCADQLKHPPYTEKEYRWKTGDDTGEMSTYTYTTKKRWDSNQKKYVNYESRLTDATSTDHQWEKPELELTTSEKMKQKAKDFIDEAKVMVDATFNPEKYPERSWTNPNFSTSYSIYEYSPKADKYITDLAFEVDRKTGDIMVENPKTGKYEKAKIRRNARTGKLEIWDPATNKYVDATSIEKDDADRWGGNW